MRRFAGVFPSKNSSPDLESPRKAIQESLPLFAARFRAAIFPAGSGRGWCLFFFASGCRQDEREIFALTDVLPMPHNYIGLACAGTLNDDLPGNLQDNCFSFILYH